MTQEPIVCIIDDDEAIRESLRLLLYAGGLTSFVYESADNFLEEEEHPTFDCMLLDMRMPGTDGLELFRILNRKHLPYPVIFITGHGDIPLAVSAIKLGAYDFLTKPFQDWRRSGLPSPTTSPRANICWNCRNCRHGWIPALRGSAM